jgi:hypothetical protein
MTQSEQIRDDLHFVRNAVARRGSLDRTPALIPVIWGAFILASFAMLDFWRTGAMWMFAVVAPLLGIASWLIGWAHARRVGERDHRAALTQAMHWGSIFIAMLVLCAIAAAHHQRFGGEAIGQVATLIVGLVYFLAGVHLDRRWMISGLLLLGGAAVVTWIPRYAWTSLGVIVFLALVIPALLVRPSNPPAGETAAT